MGCNLFAGSEWGVEMVVESEGKGIEEDRTKKKIEPKSERLVGWDRWSGGGGDWSSQSLRTAVL